MCFEKENWLASLLVNLQGLSLILAIVTMLIALKMTKLSKTVFFFSLFFFVLTSIFVSSDLFKRVSEESMKKTLGAKKFHLFYANVNSQNKNKTKLIKLLKKRKPDYVLLVEVNREWILKLKELEEIYPYSKVISKEGNFGVGVLSKHVLSVNDVLVDRENLIPSLILNSSIEGRDLNLVVLHAFPPIGKTGTLMRDQYLEAVSKKVYEMRHQPFLLCGDFNSVPWSSTMKSFVESAVGRSSKDFTYFRTWPVLLNRWALLPIDNCFTKGLSLVSYNRGPDINSDHFPLEMTFILDEKDLASE